MNQAYRSTFAKVMNAMSMEPWFNQARRLDSIESVIFFQLREDFEGHPLPSPNFSRQVPSVVRMTEVVGNEAELGKYFSEIVRLARRENLTFNDVRSYFWLRLWLGNTAAEASIGFPWYDTLAEIRQFIHAVCKYSEGHMFWDADQSWELEIHGWAGDCLLQFSNPDDEATYETIRFAHREFADNLLSTEQCAGRVIEALTKIVGQDLWTYDVPTIPEVIFPGKPPRGRPIVW
jgi:hypothetical protein